MNALSGTFSECIQFCYAGSFKRKGVDDLLACKEQSLTLIETLQRGMSTE